MTEQAVSTWRIALTFNHIALASFGGGLSAWSRHMVVEEQRWMTDEEFLSAMTVCRVLPGANQVNLAVFVGARLRGAAGAIAAVVGLTALPALIVLAMGAALYRQPRHAVGAGDPARHDGCGGRVEPVDGLQDRPGLPEEPAGLGAVRGRPAGRRGAAHPAAALARGAGASGDVVGLAKQGDTVSPATALQICLLFGGASLLSIGGGNSVVPEIELQAVGTYHWLTQAQFADLFALAQAAPGPSILIVTLVGYSAAGVMGALLATVAMVLPAGVLVFVFARLWGEGASLAMAGGVRAWTGTGRGRPDRGERRDRCACGRSLAGAVRADGAGDGGFLRDEGKPDLRRGLGGLGGVAGTGVSLRRDIAGPMRSGQDTALARGFPASCRNRSRRNETLLHAGPHFPMFRRLGPRERTRPAPVQQAVCW